MAKKVKELLSDFIKVDQQASVKEFYNQGRGAQGNAANMAGIEESASFSRAHRTGLTDLASWLKGNPKNLKECVGDDFNIPKFNNTSEAMNWISKGDNRAMIIQRLQDNLPEGSKGHQIFGDPSASFNARLAKYDGFLNATDGVKGASAAKNQLDKTISTLPKSDQQQLKHIEKATTQKLDNVGEFELLSKVKNYVQLNQDIARAKRMGQPVDKAKVNQLNKLGKDADVNQFFTDKVGNLTKNFDTKNANNNRFPPEKGVKLLSKLSENIGKLAIKSPDLKIAHLKNLKSEFDALKDRRTEVKSLLKTAKGSAKKALQAENKSLKGRLDKFIKDNKAILGKYKSTTAKRERDGLFGDRLDGEIKSMELANPDFRGKTSSQIINQASSVTVTDVQRAFIDARKAEISRLKQTMDPAQRTVNDTAVDQQQNQQQNRRSSHANENVQQASVSAPSAKVPSGAAFQGRGEIQQGPSHVVPGQQSPTRTVNLTQDATQQVNAERAQNQQANIRYEQLPRNSQMNQNDQTDFTQQAAQIDPAEPLPSTPSKPTAASSTKPLPPLPNTPKTEPSATDANVNDPDAKSADGQGPGGEVPSVPNITESTPMNAQERTMTDRIQRFRSDRALRQAPKAPTTDPGATQANIGATFMAPRAPEGPVEPEGPGGNIPEAMSMDDISDSNQQIPNASDDNKGQVKANSEYSDVLAGINTDSPGVYNVMPDAQSLDDGSQIDNLNEAGAGQYGQLELSAAYGQLELGDSEQDIAQLGDAGMYQSTNAAMYSTGDIEVEDVADGAGVYGELEISPRTPEVDGIHATDNPTNMTDDNLIYDELPPEEDLVTEAYSELPADAQAPYDADFPSGLSPNDPEYSSYDALPIKEIDELKLESGDQTYQAIPNNEVDATGNEIELGQNAKPILPKPLAGAENARPPGLSSSSDTIGACENAKMEIKAEKDAQQELGKDMDAPNDGLTAGK